ncbi:MAG: hypothetical protein KBT12_08415 [Bacteroidales bacterium]|nr:hypothetical protein [Candidatus Physcousia equi]
MTAIHKILGVAAVAALLQPCVSAQTADENLYRPYQPAGIPAGAPAWMAGLVDVEQVNYYAMEDSFERFMAENPEYRYKTPETKGIINYFRRWQKAYLPYVQHDGSIRVPQHSDFRQFVTDMNAVNRRKAAPGRKVSGTDSRWEVISPLQTYDWKTRQPYPGQSNIQCFDIAKSSPNVLYAGAEPGMIFKTEDRGEHWTSCTPDFFFGGIPSTIEISHTNPNKVLMGAGAFLWLTEDGGATWTDITPSNSSASIRDVIVSPTDDSHIIMGSRKGVYKSTDNGKTWRTVIARECFDLQQKYTKGEIKGDELYALVRETSSSNSNVQLRYSQDGGETWVLRSPQLDYKLTCGRIGLSAAENGDDYIYLVGCQNDQISAGYKWPQFFGTPQFFKSTDAGKNWTDLGLATIPDVEKSWSMGQGYYCMFCAVSSEDPETVFLGMLNFYKSTDGGKTFDNLGGYFGKYDNIHFDMQEMRVLNGEAWISHDGGLNYSTDFFSSRPEVRINGIYASEFLGFGQGWNEDVVAGGRYHNGDMAEVIGKYPGALHMGGGETYTGHVMLSDPHKVAFSDSQNFIIPDDLSEEVRNFHFFWNFPYESPSYGGYMEFDPRYAHSYLICRGWGDEQNTLWKTVDEGRSFVQLYRFNEKVCTYAISRSNPDKIVVGTNGNLYYSLDGGNSFTPYPNLPAELAASPYTRVDISPSNADEIWASVVDYAGCVFRTQDNGTTWEKMDKGLVVTSDHEGLYQGRSEQMYVKRFVLTGNEKNAVYALATVERSNGWDDGAICSRGRVFYRDDTTDGWQDYSEGLPQVITLTRMLPFYKDGKLRLATNNGIWQRDLVDKDFKPVAQPIILSGGKAQGLGAEIHLDSYSIVNQQKAQWQWRFFPEPLSVSDATVRNPVITVDPELSYNVTLTMTTPAGSDTKTVKNMIVGTRGILNPAEDDEKEEGTEEVEEGEKEEGTEEVEEGEKEEGTEEVEEGEKEEEEEIATSIVGHEVLAHDMLLTQMGERGAELRFTPHGLAAPCLLQLVGMDGQVKRTAKLSAKHTTAVSVSGLPAGTYFYLIKGGTFKKTGKLLVR